MAKRKTILTQAQKTFISENSDLFVCDIARKCKATYSIVKSYMQKNGIPMNMKKKRRSGGGKKINKGKFFQHKGNGFI